MKAMIPILFLLFFSNPEISEVRKIYVDASKTKASADAFLNKVKSISDTDPDKKLVAYKGCAIALQGKFASKIKDKKKFLTKGALLVDASIKAEPNNVELRMIRLSIQETLPLIITSYRKNIKEDKAYILAHYKSLEPEMESYIKNFIQQSESFSADEKQAAK